ncbi:MAG: TIGR03960 family B12-binding radical SAM protein [Clostridia bacterium]|nr:TIGR03960 family B12-binding radical SAM protein [Clostridia bacterium]
MYQEIDRVLKKVQKPARYIGNEYNMVIKDVETVDVRFAFAFPDTYEVGMSHLGLKILYHLMNERDDVFCERVFAPWLDMEEQMRGRNIPLFSLETRTALNDFDLIGFTLQYEMCYTNILTMLDLGNIPLFSKERELEHPFIIAGGPSVYNPEPLADIIDFFVVGEAENVINDIIDVYKEWRHLPGKSRDDFLKQAARLPGIYVPKFYNVEYYKDGRIKEFYPMQEGCPVKIKKNIITDMDKVYYPDNVIVPFTDIVHDRIVLEIFRGCTRGCRFCQAGMVYRPVREKSISRLMELSQDLIKNTGYEQISLASLSTGDYSEIEDLILKLMEKNEGQKVSLSLPSLRLDSFSKEFIKQIKKVKKTGLTFAPEAGTQRLRNVINKGIDEKDLINSAITAFEFGWTSLKFYFMLGLPTEQDEDVEAIFDLTQKVVDEYKKMSKPLKRLKITVSTSTFVPKAFTPFQWEPQLSISEIHRRQQYLNSLFKNKRITYNWHDAELSYLEAVFARGDRKLNKVLYRAWQKGCRFDSWNSNFNYQKWMQAFEECHIDPDFYVYRKRNYDEILPWDHIDAGVSKQFLIKEHKRALKGITTPDCREACINCGVKNLKEGVCER